MAALQQLAIQEISSRRKAKSNTVIGFVCPTDGHTHSIVRANGEWVTTTDEADVFLAVALERVVRSNKRFIIIIGGRGSGKSVGVADIGLLKAKDEGVKTYCLREYQSSIKNSVQSLLTEETRRLELSGFKAQGSSLLYNNEEMFQFAGLARNVDSIKSAHGFGCYQVEEAQFISYDSLTALTPTARNKPNKGLPKSNAEIELDDFSGVSMIFIANPMSSADPFSTRFIVPFKSELDQYGYYEDDLHLIIKMNYTDNPWYAESGLDEERVFDKANKSRDEYSWIWGGEFNDSVENSLIKAEWFDACIDAHKALGFSGVGAKIATHDPSDKGPDSKGYAMRHGAVVLDVQEKQDGDVNEGGHWAADLAIQQGVDNFSWDGDGMGIALNEQMSRDFDGKRVDVTMFRGSEGADNPDAMYNPALMAPVQNQNTNKNTFKNKRAQYYFELRDRIYRTYRAVVHSEYQDPDKLLSFDSSIKLLPKLRSELCRMPIKPNGSGLFELYTKPDMKTKFKLVSPNLGDSVMMLMRHIKVNNMKPVIPRPLQSIGRR